MHSRFVIRESAVASDIIDGEAIIMQLRTGLYFSTRGSGAVVWSALLAGCATDSLVESLAASAGASADIVRRDLEEFMAAAEQHKLGEFATKASESAQTAAPTMEGPWVAPVLEVFTDMQDLLLLDPIHDVSDQMGWPQQRPA